MKKPKAIRMVITVLVDGDIDKSHMHKVCCEYTQGLGEEGCSILESYTEDISGKHMKGTLLKTAKARIAEEADYTHADVEERFAGSVSLENIMEGK